MNPELIKILQSLFSYAVKKPFEVQMVAPMLGINKDVVTELLGEFSEIADKVADDGEATSAMLQKVLARKTDLMPTRNLEPVSHYVECPHCSKFFKI